MDNFINNIDRIIDERKSVLFEIERVIFTGRYGLSDKHIEIFSVQSIAMIYAIWEGFIQKAFKSYIDHLNSFNMEFDKFNENIIIYNTESSFKQLMQYPNKANKKIQYYSKLREYFSKDYHHLVSFIDTESNVGFETVNKLLKIFNLEVFPLNWGNYKYPSPNLEEMLKTFLRYRNGVAHGGDITSEEKVTQKVFEKYKSLVINLMYGVQERMIDGICNKTYKKTNST